MGGRGKDLVAFVAVVAAAMWGTWLFVRTQLDLGASWTDGAQRYETVAGEGIRFAVWDVPEPLPGSTADGEAEARPALSPDGRYLVFAAGERGLNADLFVADLVGGELVDPRPLGLVNSAFDDLAPAFGPDALYFSSDRGGAGFGLDLWRAPYSDGVFGTAESIGSGVNTASDETDPCPIPGTRAFVFASNRPRGQREDFELYRAELRPGADAERAYDVAALDALNTPFDEREGALTSDGRTLIFASDRDGSLGGFDLYRSFLEENGWLPPKPLIGINTERSERGPLLSADGFSLFFDVTEDGSPPSLWSARSMELFRVPGPPLSLPEILVIVLLLVLAALALLAKRWRTLDIIYKCFLISLLVHLMLMWYLREVFPESGPLDAPGDARAFRVRLAPAQDGASSAERERNGELQLEARRIEESEAEPLRAESRAELAAASPSATEFAAPEHSQATPARSDAHLAESRSQARTQLLVQEREAPLERQVGTAPALAVSAQERAPAPVAARAVAPERVASAVHEPRAQPSAASMEAAAAPADRRSSDPAPIRLTPTPAATVPAATAVQQPRESFERARAEAPAMSLPQVAAAAAPRRSTEQAARRAAARPSTDAVLGAAQPQAADLAELQPRRRPEQVAVGPRSSASEPLLTQTEPAVDVRNLEEALAPQSRTAESRRFDPTSELPRTNTVRKASTTADPRRAAPTSATSVAAATPTRPSMPEPSPDGPRTPASAEPRERSRRDATTPLEAAVLVRAVDEPQPGQAQPTPVARRFDPTAELAPTQPRRREPTAPDAPAARRFVPARSRPPAEPEFRALTAAAAPAPVTTDDRPQRMEQTPYRNRFGDEKLRALEEYGGGTETERAVEAGLRYLASIQSSRGFWGEKRDFHDKYHDVRVGKTGLALLAFLGAGHTPNAETEHATVAERAVRYLLRTQDDDSGHFGDSSAYSHGIAAYALAECYALTRDDRLRKPLEEALAHILAEQSTRSDPRFSGGWGYYYSDGRVWNNDPWPRVSVTVWQVMALESARIGGLEVPDRAFEGAREFLVNAWDPGRRAFRYSHDPNRLSSGYPILPASTPAALFGLSLLGIDVASAELEQARRFVLQRAPREYRYVSDDAFVADARGNLYFWYYGTLAMFRVGGSPWERWNAAMKDTLLDSQQGDGSWQPISIYASYAGDDGGERTYSTAMCVLSLEVYYRYFTPLLQVR